MDNDKKIIIYQQIRLKEALSLCIRRETAYIIPFIGKHGQFYWVILQTSIANKGLLLPGTK